MRSFNHLCFTDRNLNFSEELPLRAGLLTSLGFGHVNAGLLVLNSGAFEAALTAEQLTDYQERAAQREHHINYRWEAVKMGKSDAFKRAQHRRFIAKDGTKAQSEEESAMLLNPEARLFNGLYQSAQQ